jgi:predicted RNA-binding Zn ribbon-like protein
MSRARNAGFTPQSPWLDLVNSRMSDGFDHWTDHLRDSRWVAGFLEYWGPDARGLAPTSAPMQLAELRGMLRRLTEKAVSGARLGPPDIRVLNQYLKEPTRIQIEGAGAALVTVRRPVRPGWRWIKAQVVSSFLEDAQERWVRIKTCGNPECRWAFVDTTRANTRRWCRDERCGNRLRVRRARQ